jgi:radical SAM-linked protein
LKDRLSPPCGKPFGSLLHHGNLEAHDADGRRLVCYDCGVACDLGGMRAERREYLLQLGAAKPPEPVVRAPRAAQKKQGRRTQAPAPQFTQGAGTRYRLRYTKLLRAAFISHLDVSRLLQRLFRRARVEQSYTLGFHPKPDVQFGPALGLGVPSLGELVDVRLDVDIDAEELRARLNEVAPEGISFLAARRLGTNDPGLSKLVRAADLLVRVDEGDGAAAAAALMARDSAFVARGERQVDVRKFLLGIGPAADGEALRRALDWPAGELLVARISTTAEGSAKASELLSALGLRGEAARLGLVGLDGEGREFDPLAPPPTSDQIVRNSEEVTA